MKTHYTISNAAGEVVVENIFDRLAAEDTARRLVETFCDDFTIREYGHRSTTVFKYVNGGVNIRKTPSND